MFEPPRCPRPECPRHAHPTPDFFVFNGFYHPKCRPRGVPRFVCRTCRKGFSRQTFRADYRDHRPHLNAEVFRLLASGVGLRQTSRLVGLSLRCTELKFRKIARHLGYLNANLRGPLPAGSSLQFDELETYEARRNTRPLTLPLLIEKGSRFMVAARSAPIRPRGTMTPARRRAIAADERRLGRRKDASRAAIRRVLADGARLVKDHRHVVLFTDEKSSYPGLAREAFGEDRLEHHTTSSKLPRTAWNPLFPINHTEAMARDLMGRLRRESWLVSKNGWCLDLHLQLFMAYRNFVRRRFNRDAESPAQLLGYADRRLRPEQVLTWRQDWGERSIHPLSDGTESVARWRARHAA